MDELLNEGQQKTALFFFLFYKNEFMKNRSCHISVTIT